MGCLAHSGDFPCWLVLIFGQWFILGINWDTGVQTSSLATTLCDHFKCSFSWAFLYPQSKPWTPLPLSFSIPLIQLFVLSVFTFWGRAVFLARGGTAMSENTRSLLLWKFLSLVGEAGVHNAVIQINGTWQLWCVPWLRGVERGRVTWVRSHGWESFTDVSSLKAEMASLYPQNPSMLLVPCRCCGCLTSGWLASFGRPPFFPSVAGVMQQCVRNG